MRRTALTVSAHIMLPISFKSSLSTLVKTACLIFIILIERATFSGSSQSTSSGLPVFTPQKPQERVQTLPKIIKVAVPSPQHSPMFGQLPEVQMVLSLYLSTRPLNSVYFFPVGSLTRSHFGLGSRCSGKIFERVLVSININFKTTKIQSNLLMIRL